MLHCLFRCGALANLLSYLDAQIKKSSIAHAPFQTEEDWVDQVAEATESGGSDPTVVNAGLTELEAPNQTNGALETQPEANAAGQINTGDASGNLAGERWDTDAAGTGAEKGGMEDSYVHVPRPDAEVEVPAEASTHQPQGSNWAEDVPSHEASGNVAGEAWDTKAPGEQQEDGWAATGPAATNGTADDGFSEVPSGRRGGRGRGGDGEFRGRGGRRGNFRGRGDGEYRGRGRGGRGRGGPRGGAEGPAAAARS